MAVHDQLTQLTHIPVNIILPTLNQTTHDSVRASSVATVLQCCQLSTFIASYRDFSNKIRSTLLWTVCEKQKHQHQELKHYTYCCTEKTYLLRNKVSLTITKKGEGIWETTAILYTTSWYGQYEFKFHLLTQHPWSLLPFILYNIHNVELQRKEKASSFTLFHKILYKKCNGLHISSCNRLKNKSLYCFVFCSSFRTAVLVIGTWCAPINGQCLYEYCCDCLCKFNLLSFFPPHPQINVNVLSIAGHLTTSWGNCQKYPPMFRCVCWEITGTWENIALSFLMI